MTFFCVFAMAISWVDRAMQLDVVDDRNGPLSYLMFCHTTPGMLVIPDGKWGAVLVNYDSTSSVCLTGGSRLEFR